jgi:hypothetical protein
MPVTVVNKYHYSGNGTYIGRGGTFGNPFTHLSVEETKATYQVASREEAIEKYREWAKQQWVENETFRLALTALVKKHLRGDEVVLACTCKPKPCHGDVLKEMIEGLAFLGIVTLGPGEEKEWWEYHDHMGSKPKEEKPKITDADGDAPF